MTSTMRVGTMTGPGDLELRDEPIPEPGPGEALVRISASAICTWEQRTWSGAQRNRFPFVGGHETVGTVAALGPDVDWLAVGDRVALGPFACGHCHWCLTGRDRHCALHYSDIVSYRDAWGPGGFAEYKVHAASSLFLLGDAPDAAAALAEPLACALHAARLLDLPVASEVVVLGAGVMGLLNVVALKLRGARVIVSEMDAGRLARAATLGADELIDASADDPVARVRALTEGRGADAVIAAFGGATANEQGLAMLAPRGRHVLFAAAHPEPELTLAPNHLHDTEIGVLGFVSKEREDFYAATRVIRHGLADLTPLVEATYPLAELRAALDHAVRPGTYRVLVAA